MSDLPKLQDAIATAHDALVDILEAEQGDSVHYLTLPEFYKIEKMAHFLGELYDRMQSGASQWGASQ